MIEKGLLIAGVEEDSIGFEMGICRGDRLLSINGETVLDTVEFKFHEASEELVLKIKKSSGEVVDFDIEKDFYEEVGLVFEDMISDPKVCTNNCIFCFVDQMPQGMRKSLYIKDDDSRMSFLQGSFVTLTNMKDEDIDRIIRYRISPINVSIHTTDSELRKKMLGNRFAGKIMEYLKRLTDAGIEVKGQIVLCPGWNDGEYLKKTIFDLAALWPSMSCLAIVPVGVTRFRNGLPHLDVVDEVKANEVLDQVEGYQKELLERLDSRFVYCSDEFYLIGNRKMMSFEEYEGFPQIEDGVGLVTLFRDEIQLALEDLDALEEVESGYGEEPIGITVMTGEYAGPILDDALAEIGKRVKGLTWRVIQVKNEVFGDTVKVAGLLTGSDLIRSIRTEGIMGDVLITDAMLKEGTTLFLDDLNVEDLEKEGVRVHCAREDGSDLVEIIVNLLSM